MLAVTVFNPMFIFLEMGGIIAFGIMTHKKSDQHIFLVTLGFVACQNFKCVFAALVAGNE